jgi:hypothetical protein
MYLILVYLKTSELEIVYFSLWELVQIGIFTNFIDIGESYIKVDFFVLEDLRMFHNQGV